MSNVRIEATGEESLSVDVTLGGNVRATHSIEAGAAVDLAVGGNQKLTVSAVESVVEAEVPTATLEQGADVAPELEDFDINTDVDEDTSDAPADEEIGGVIDDSDEAGETGDTTGFFDIPESEDEKEDGGETVTIGPEDVGSIDVLDLPADAAIEIEQPFAGEAAPEATTEA